MSGRNAVLTVEPARARQPFEVDNVELSGVIHTLDFEERGCVA